ncbi:MAG: hypothetical protein ABI411_16270 [Tahibacter sp.]
MSNRTFACLVCKKLQRKPRALDVFLCPVCKFECIRVHAKLHVPATRKLKKWNTFWAQYLTERSQLAEFHAGRGPAEICLPLLSQRWVRAKR